MINIQKKESETIEFKESMSELENAGETLCAFANQRGGDLYFGVKNNGEVKGIPSINEKTTRDISQYIFDNLEPKKIISIDQETIEGISILKISIGKSDTPYHTFRKKPYIRIGASTKLMPQEEYQHRLMLYKSTNKDYSSQIISEAKLSDLSSDAIVKLRALLMQSGRYDVDISKLTDEQLLKDLLLIRDNQLTIASLVLLGSESALSNFLPYSEVRFGYKISESEIRNQDTAIFKGGYLLYYDRIWEKIQARNLTLSIPLGMRLVEKKAFDEQTIREAVNNAIIHRDYLVQESSFIMQYPIKIVIKSPGGFPEGITINNIMFETKPRNKLLADLLFKCELVEQFGNGVNLMYKNQLGLGKSPPNYRQSTDKRVALELDGKIQDLEFAKYVLRVAENKNKVLNDVELLILNKIKNNQSVVPNETTEELLNLGLIERRGFKKFMLSKQYYEDTNQKGIYTKQKGLTKSTNKALILKHLQNFGSGRKEDIAQIFNYEMNEKTLWKLLDELKKEEKIYFDGKPRSRTGQWKLKDK